MGRKTDTGQLFKLIRELNGQPPVKENHAIRFKGKYLSSATNIANQFNNQFSSVMRHRTSRSFRTITKACRHNPLDNPPKYDANQTTEAIKKCKASKAIGPDGLSNLHLKHLGPAAINYLTGIYNISMGASILPDIWKKSIIVPLLKPGKDPSDSKSYRPVSLLCPAIKILERLILPVLNENLPIPNFQHGFRAQHSTVTALNNLNIDIADGFNEKKPPARTVLLQIDLSKAFDMVSHSKLLQDMKTQPFPPPSKDGSTPTSMDANQRSNSATAPPKLEMFALECLKEPSVHQLCSIFTSQNFPYPQVASKSYNMLMIFQSTAPARDPSTL